MIYKYWSLSERFSGRSIDTSESSIRRIEDQLPDVFSSSAVCVLGSYVKYVGREAVASFFRDVVFNHYYLTVHMAHNPEIDVESSHSATGTWVYEAYLLGGESEDQATWLTGWYDDVYEFESGAWKIASTRPTYFFNSDIGTSWQRAFVALGDRSDTGE